VILSWINPRKGEKVIFCVPLISYFEIGRIIGSDPLELHQSSLSYRMGDKPSNDK
jgi:hypothetical protein